MMPVGKKSFWCFFGHKIDQKQSGEIFKNYFWGCIMWVSKAENGYAAQREHRTTEGLETRPHCCTVSRGEQVHFYLNLFLETNSLYPHSRHKPHIHRTASELCFRTIFITTSNLKNFMITALESRWSKTDQLVFIWSTSFSSFMFFLIKFWWVGCFSVWKYIFWTGFSFQWRLGQPKPKVTKHTGLVYIHPYWMTQPIISLWHNRKKK